ncbi:MAG: type II toxin-antitoxin system VapC family toxin [Armatimonadaceae bacterium]
MELVLDASVVVALLVRDSPMDIPNAVLDAIDDGAIVTVPPHFQLEVANFLVQAQRSGKLSAAGAQQALRYLQHLPITVDSSMHGQIFTDVIAIAHRTGITSYDAAYIHLARTRGARLASLDKQLLAAAKAEGVDVLAC